MSEVCDIETSTSTGPWPSLDPNWSQPPPGSCTLTLIKNSPSDPKVSLWLHYFDFSTATSETFNCYPPSFASTTDPIYVGTFSPGLKCPGGWAEVSTTVLSSKPFDSGDADPLTTALTCCPTDYGSLVTLNPACTATVTTQTVVSYSILPGNSVRDPAVRYDGITTVGPGGTAVVKSLVLYYQSADLRPGLKGTACRTGSPSVPTEYSNSTSTKPASETGVGLGAPISNVGISPLTSESKSQPSTGAIVGIVLGICALIIVVAFLLLRRRRHKRETAVPEEISVTGGESVETKDVEVAKPIPHENAEPNVAAELPAQPAGPKTTALETTALGTLHETEAPIRRYETQAAPRQEHSISRAASPRVEHHAVETAHINRNL